MGQTYVGAVLLKEEMGKLAPIAEISMKRRGAQEIDSKIDEWILHDLRRTFSSGSAKLGTPATIIDRCLNHAVDKVPGIYNRHRYAPEMAAAWKLWSDHVANLAKGRRND